MAPTSAAGTAALREGFVPRARLNFVENLNPGLVPSVPYF
jgi:hypothetical protein